MLIYCNAIRFLYGFISNYVLYTPTTIVNSAVFFALVYFSSFYYIYLLREAWNTHLYQLSSSGVDVKRKVFYFSIAFSMFLLFFLHSFCESCTFRSQINAILFSARSFYRFLGIKCEIDKIFYRFPRDSRRTISFTCVVDVFIFLWRIFISRA